MSWSLVTAPDERARCCVVIDGVRCERPTAWKIAGDAWDDYAYTCPEHLDLVRASSPGHTVERVGD